MQALLLIAHGSRRQASNSEVLALTDRIRDAAGSRFELVTAAFLELASPSISEALESCVRNGVTRLKVAPYFLAGGTHVTQDVPAAISAFTDEHPDIAVEIIPHIGGSEHMPQLVLASATA